MEIELPLADCPQNLDIFGMITRKDVDAGDIFFDAVLQDTNFFINSARRMQCQVYLCIAFFLNVLDSWKKIYRKNQAGDKNYLLRCNILGLYNVIMSEGQDKVHLSSPKMITVIIR